MRWSSFDRIGDGLIGGTLAAIVLLCYVFSCLGCATTKCPPCVPEQEIVTIQVPVLSCPVPAVLPTLTYPEWPKPPQIASEGAVKGFYADVVATSKAREKILLDRIQVLDEQIQQYRGEDTPQ